MVRNRGLDKGQLYLGDLRRLVAGVIERKGRARVLEAGCGHGIAMLDLAEEFGEALEITGFNLTAVDGDDERLHRLASDRGVEHLPRIVFCDASKPLPFDDGTFDVVYSMASLYLYDDKLAFLAECNRILAEDGVARINPSLHFLNTELPEHRYNHSWEIWREGELVALPDFLDGIDGVEFHGPRHGDGVSRSYIELHKRESLDFGVRLVSSIDTNFLWHEWGGVLSVYSTQRSFVPRYKRAAG